MLFSSHYGTVLKIGEEMLNGSAEWFRLGIENNLYKKSIVSEKNETKELYYSSRVLWHI
jgi:hypothetical protein